MLETVKSYYESTLEWLRKNLKGDWVIWTVAIALLLCSIPIVYSASVKDAYANSRGNTEQYLFKHVLLCIAALVIMYAIHTVPYTRLIPISRIGVWISIPLLALTLIGGEKVNDAARWIEIPIINYRLQPSEIAKVLLISHLSLVLARHLKGRWDTKKLLREPMLLTGLVCVLIFPENHSTALILGSVCFMLMFVGNVPLKYLIYIGSILLVLGWLTISMKYTNRSGTAQNRLSTFMRSDTVGYQSMRSYMAMARGGLKGEGTAKSQQRRFLPEPQKDFIYAITIEEYGTLGGLGLIIAYLLLLYRGLRAINKTKRPFGGLLSAGLTFSIVFQAFTTMAVTVGLFPVTGQALPFFSQGGTSMIFTAVAIGMILSVSRGEFDEVNV